MKSPHHLDPEALSALVDGEADAQEAEAVRAAWRQVPELRARWHDYHLIGDVLRSEDLASDAGHDADFLVRLRARLAAEPVVLAPTPAPAAVRPAAVRRRWAGVGAVAAGFVVVVGAALSVLAPPADPDSLGAPGLARVEVPGSVGPDRPAAPADLALVAGPAPAELAAAPLPRERLREAGLSPYLDAHAQLAGGRLASPYLRTVRHADDADAR